MFLFGSLGVWNINLPGTQRRSRNTCTTVWISWFVSQLSNGTKPKIAILCYFYSRKIKNHIKKSAFPCNKSPMADHRNTTRDTVIFSGPDSLGGFDSTATSMYHVQTILSSFREDRKIRVFFGRIKSCHVLPPFWDTFHMFGGRGQLQAIAYLYIRERPIKWKVPLSPGLRGSGPVVSVNTLTFLCYIARHQLWILECWISFWGIVYFGGFCEPFSVDLVWGPKWPMAPTFERFQASGF